MKRLKDSDNLLGGQVPVPPGGSLMPRFAGPSDSVDRNVASLSANIPSKDVPGSDQNGSQSGTPSKIMTSAKIEHSHMSPEMSSAWFEKYG